MTDTLYDKNDTAKNEELIKSMRPGSGRRIKEDYSVVNIADCFTVDNSGNVCIRILLNGGNATLTNLLITGDLTVNGNFNFGDVGTDILSIAGYIKGVTAGKKFVAIGNATTSHTLVGNDDLVVDGYLEINKMAYLDAGLSATTGAFSGQISSTLAIGTAPFAITSTTKVANLNADLLDDQEGSYYLNAGNLTGTLSDSRLSNNVPLLNAANVFSNVLNTFQNIALATGMVTLSAGTAITAGSYQIGRDLDATNQMHLNVPTGAGYEFSFNDVAKTTISSGGNWTISGTASTSDLPKIMSITPPNNTGTTASTDNPQFNFGASTQTHAAGAITNASYFNIGSPTFAFNGASTITNAYNLYVDIPIAGTNATLSNIWSIGAAGGIRTAGKLYAVSQVVAGNGGVNIDSGTLFGIAAQGRIYAANTYSLLLGGQPTEGETAVGVNIGSSTALSTAGALIAQFWNATVAKASIDKDGKIFAQVNKQVACGGGSTGGTTTPNGTVTLEINGVSYYLLTAAAA